MKPKIKALLVGLGIVALGVGSFVWNLGYIAGVCAQRIGLAWYNAPICVLYDWLADARVDAESDQEKKLLDALHDLGSVEGIVVVCARSPHVDDETSLRWRGWSIELTDIATDYAAHIHPDNEAARAVAQLAFGAASLEQQQEPERIWGDPRGCDRDTASKVNTLILEWSIYLHSLGA